MKKTDNSINMSFLSATAGLFGCISFLVPNKTTDYLNNMEILGYIFLFLSITFLLGFVGYHIGSIYDRINNLENNYK